MEEIIDINGVQYLRREHNSISNKHRTISKILMMSMLLGNMGYINNVMEDKDISNIDIIKEYKLIQIKKSNLSKSKRDWVEYQFRLNYIKK